MNEGCSAPDPCSTTFLLDRLFDMEGLMEGVEGVRKERSAPECTWIWEESDNKCWEEVRWPGGRGGGSERGLRPL